MGLQEKLLSHAEHLARVFAEYHVDSFSSFLVFALWLLGVKGRA
jgi:hypothetical protein